MVGRIDVELLNLQGDLEDARYARAVVVYARPVWDGVEVCTHHEGAVGAPARIVGDNVARGARLRDGVRRDADRRAGYIVVVKFLADGEAGNKYWDVDPRLAEPAADELDASRRGLCPR